LRSFGRNDDNATQIPFQLFRPKLRVGRNGEVFCQLFWAWFGVGENQKSKIRNQKSLMMTVPTRRLARIAAEILFAAQGGSIAGCWRQKDCSEKPEIASNIFLY